MDDDKISKDDKQALRREKSMVQQALRMQYRQSKIFVHTMLQTYEENVRGCTHKADTVCENL
jgi:hypothetical protein